MKKRYCIFEFRFLAKYVYFSSWLVVISKQGKNKRRGRNVGETDTVLVCLKKRRYLTKQYFTTKKCYAYLK